MTRNPRLLLIVGVVLLLAGAFLSFGSSAPSADPAQAAQCRERMRDAGAEMQARCDEAAVATAMTATNADEAAASISAMNNGEVGGNTLGMFLLGLGLVLTLAGVLAHRKQARPPAG
jgi:type II secretory pathway component PulM